MFFLCTRGKYVLSNTALNFRGEKKKTKCEEGRKIAHCWENSEYVFVFNKGLRSWGWMSHSEDTRFWEDTQNILNKLQLSLVQISCSNGSLNLGHLLLKEKDT